MTRQTAECRSCHAAIFWASTAASGKPMPLNFDPDPDGNVTIIASKHGPVATVLGPLEQLLAHGDRTELYMPHHATCPHTEAWKR